MPDLSRHVSPGECLVYVYTIQFHKYSITISVVTNWIVFNVCKSKLSFCFENLLNVSVSFSLVCFPITNI